MSKRITHKQLADYLSDEETALLDIRPIAAYNGWPLRNEERGGHIPGAVPFPGKWFGELEQKEITRLLQEKNISPDKRVIITGYDLREKQTTADYLERLGYREALIDSEGMIVWAADTQRPMTRLPRHHHLVHPDWLADLLDGNIPDDQVRPRFVVAHVNFDIYEDYEKGHIPGALWLNTVDLEEEETWNRRSPKEIRDALLALGITSDTTVVLYGRFTSPDMSQEHPGKRAGQIAAKRAAMLLSYAGVEDVRVLDGGLDSWEGAGYGLVTDPVKPVPATDFGAQAPAHPEYIVSLEKAKEMLKDSQAELVSVRSWSEFIGDVSGYHYVGPRGRIPGAVFGNCGTDAYHMENYRNSDNTMRDYEEITLGWEKRGITPNKHIAFYCGTGWRAGEAWHAAWLMGWDRVSVFDGGWYEWSSVEGNPLETGVPEDQPMIV